MECVLVIIQIGYWVVRYVFSVIDFRVVASLSSSSGPNKNLG